MSAAAPHADLVDAMLRTFGGAGAKIVATPSGGTVTERSAITRADLRDHLAGRRRIGAMPFTDPERVRWACIDLDARLWGSEPDDPDVMAMIVAIVETLALENVRAVLERSKSKGWHLWIILDAPAPARDVRALLRRVAMQAGAPDAADLVCPRSDRRPDIGNGTWLPLFGGDAYPHTRIYEVDADTGDWLPADDQEAALRSLLTETTPAGAIPEAEPEAEEEPESHPCAWILEELAEAGVTLRNVRYGVDKIEFACPLHVADHERAAGGSAVFFARGVGSCASARCGRRWRSVGDFLAQLGKAEAPRAHVVTLDTVATERVRWLWEGRIPAGKLTVADGDPGLGKSMMTLDLAARITTGRAMPDGAPGIQGGAGVVLLSAEDGAGDTIRPRLEAAGAALARVAMLREITDGDGPRIPALPTDLEILEETTRKMGAALVVVDPLSAFLHGEVNTNRDHDVRRALAPLAQMAERTGAAVLVVRHLNKGGSGTGNPLYRGGGSIGIIGAARAGLLVARDPDDEDRRVLAVTKCNLAALPPALGWRIVAGPHGVGIDWLGAVEHSTETLVTAQDGADRTARQEAEDWLRDALAAGPRPAKEIRKAARADGIADRTLDRAKARLGVRARKAEFSGGWDWEIPA